MFKIVEKKVLSPSVKQYAMDAPRIAQKCHPGQFVIIRIDEEGERIPLTIADFDREKGTISLLFQEVGASTQQLGQLEEGDSLLDIAGPLGKPTDIQNFGTVVCVGGGIGVAPVYPIARAMKEAGNRVISIIGARNEDLLIFEDEMKNVSDELYVTTDDGSKGVKGFVTDVLKRLIDEGEKIAEVMAIGPVVMMRGVAEVTRPYGIHTVVSLNPIMVDGTGMCGGCRVAVGDENKFACVDGPEFDAHKVDFANLIARQKMYLPQEKKSCESGRSECHCHR
ncbi:MAG: sulfide/dihydroorotate dehydrogenase-like FAD/NAD-binding protein [Sporomusaceae bacterium]|nr:sulfide/dihydroorotate dehydrogenase-like FAD/NAD-binding protein [Sporomusaceae bacterium]